MALSAPGWTGRFAGFLRFLMAAFAVLMESVFRRKSLSFCLGLMTINTQFAGGLALLPGMVTFQAIDLERFGMFLMGECHSSKWRIECNNSIFIL